MRTSSGLDHIGICARSAAPLWEAYERLGFTLTPIARQSRGDEPLGTGNRCAMLRRGYIELLAILDPALPDNGLGAMLDRFEGARILALGMDDSQGNLERLRRAGLEIPGISPLSRPVEPGGPVARFERLPLPEAPEGRVQLVRHLTPEAIWQERWMRHPNGATELRAAIIATAQPAESAARLSRLSGLPLEPDPAGGFALHLPDGARVRMLSPEVAAGILPGVEPPALPAVIGMVVGVADLRATGAALLGVPHRETPGGLMVSPGEAGGCALVFAA
ncbi:VOC family protein [Roseomonas sp. SSH11]|uniref:VOC family protein n=1 Tax=Pararoseomonas baculiformis TaxID=2820812 RepID=A0ABS4A8E1_9PROT|nr:VOC family protein [Pararoseomonas baculiformis]MBP0443268.1 VOC family protein [Pararoseomonas baculiformis]